MVDFALGEWTAQAAADDPQAAGPAARLTKKVVRAVEGLELLGSAGEDESFSIPDAPDDKDAKEKGLTQVLAMQAMPLVNRVFPYDTWPWMTAREVLFVVSGDNRYSKLVIENLYANEQIGPLGHWTLARLGRFLSPDLARLFAARGLERLDPESFARDGRLIAENNRLLGKLARETARLLSDLEADELALLTKRMPEKYRLLVTNCAHTARAARGQDDTNLAIHVLDAAWQNGLQTLIRDDLRRLAK